MTRTNHFSVKVQYPVYAIDFLTEDIIAYAGGGGASRSGVTNAIVSAFIVEQVLHCPD
jgi:prolactin regulatory element-binding protein